MPSRLTAAGRRVSPSEWWVGSVYAVCVAVIATVGFVGGSTFAILLAAVLSLPASVIAIPTYYLAYGLLALVPGANPQESSGLMTCTAGGECSSSTTGDLAGWFQVTTDALGVLALTCAAILDVLALRFLRARRRSAGRL